MAGNRRLGGPGVAGFRRTAEDAAGAFDARLFRGPAGPAQPPAWRLLPRRRGSRHVPGPISVERPGSRPRSRPSSAVRLRAAGPTPAHELRLRGDFALTDLLCGPICYAAGEPQGTDGFRPHSMAKRITGPN